MSKVDQEMNHELIIELYEVKRQLKIAEENFREQENQQVEARGVAINLQMKLFDVENQQATSKGKILSQERIIYDMTVACNNLQNENVYLRERNQLLETLTRVTGTNYNVLPEAQESFSEVPQVVQQQLDSIESVEPPKSNSTHPKLWSKVINEPPQSTEMDKRQSQKTSKKKQVSEIASKLKLKTIVQKTSNPAQTKPPAGAQKPSNLRIFVGRLDHSCDEKSLRDYFGSYGDVADVYFPKNKSGLLRGFAFVTFSRFYGDHPLETSNHVINGRFVYLDVSSYLKGDGEPTNTLIASGTIQNTSTKTLTDYFSKYGDCVAVRRSKENGSKFSRWAFVQFRDIESVDKVLADEEHVIKGEMVDCRRHLCAAPPKRCHANAAMNPQPIQSAVTSGDSVRVTKLCIHSLAIKTTTETMRKYFSKFGTIVDAYVPTYYGTDKSKGFGYIVMPSEEAYFNFSHHIIDGKAVSISKEAPSQDTEESSTLLVSAGPQIMMKITEEDLKKFFSRFGKILSVRMKTDPGTNKPSHYAFVQFTSCEPVEKALANLAYKINGNIVCIAKSRFDPHK